MALLLATLTDVIRWIDVGYLIALVIFRTGFESPERTCKHRYMYASPRSHCVRDRDMLHCGEQAA